MTITSFRPHFSGIILVIPMALAAMLLVQCNDTDTDAGQTQTRTDTRQPAATGGGYQAITWSDLDANSDGTGARRMYLYPGERPASPTPAAERAMAMADLRGLRAILQDDLAIVRNRLNDGSHTNVQKEADRSLAAELAQGLERVDRAMLALEASNDGTWSSLREAQLNEVAGVRTWMVGYRETQHASR